MLCYDQNKIKYCEEGLAPYGDNCYVLKKDNRKSRSGTFERTQEMDDGRQWEGVGTFREEGNKIIISKIRLIEKKLNFSTSTYEICDTLTIPATVFLKKISTWLNTFLMLMGRGIEKLNIE